jgi:hypothetical protein
MAYQLKRIQKHEDTTLDYGAVENNKPKNTSIFSEPKNEPETKFDDDRYLTFD